MAAAGLGLAHTSNVRQGGEVEVWDVCAASLLGCNRYGRQHKSSTTVRADTFMQKHKSLQVSECHHV